METLLVFHEVDDVDRWAASPKREELFGPKDIKVRTFRDPDNANRVGLILEVPDRSTFDELLESEDAADAMKYDGVRPETLVTLVET